MRNQQSRIMTHGAAALWLFSCLCVPGACGGGGDRPPDTPVADTAPTGIVPLPADSLSAQLVALGDSLFHGRIPTGICYSCHGMDARGTQLGPDLTDTTWLNGNGSLRFIMNTVRNGVLQPKQHAAPMPPFSAVLTDEQVRAVSAYVFTLTHQIR